MARQSKPIEWPSEASNVMRGVAGNLIWEAQRLQEYMDNLSSCATCSHVFDLRDKRHAIVEGHHYCPACNLEAVQKSTLVT